MLVSAAIAEPVPDAQLDIASLLDGNIVVRCKV